MSKPSYDRGWISCHNHWPQSDLPVLWKPFDDGPNVPSQFVSKMLDIDLTGQELMDWSWMPTGIYRELAWENGYVRYGW